MKKSILLTLAASFVISTGYSQTGNLWKASEGEIREVSKNAQRESFPSEFKLYDLNLASLKQTLSSAQNKGEVIISLPNTEGKMERFRMTEHSNFDAELQAQYPEIRSYAGVGIDDKYAQVRLSIDPRGIQTMVFRAGKRNEFMEPYSADGKTYAVFNSNRNKGHLPFTCSTEDHAVASDLADKLNSNERSSVPQLKTFRLALSCNGEYANYFGATSAAQSGLVLAAFNATMTRVNGVFEKDFAIHMNIVAQTTNVIYYTPATDPYTTIANWNVQLQNTLSANLTGTGTPLATNNAAYDIGHMFGSTGGGGSAGCIGCVCVNDTASTTDTNKGAGKTSPADGVPAGDTFDIDYVAHEMGHQFGANHTFSHGLEPYNVNVEPGSGSTIMGYAGITSYNVQMNSDDYFHAVSIAQVQSNMTTKTCQTDTAITHGTPVVNAGANYTIPMSTPFMLTGSATDSGGNPLVYCWEQIDSAFSDTGAQSVASPTKIDGPNWRSFDPTPSPTRVFPTMSAILNGQVTSIGPGGIVVEALSSVARTLNFRLTARDNIVGGGQTNFDDMVVTVDATRGPLTVTSQNTPLQSWTPGSSQTITWNVNNTNTSTGGSTVDILLSTDGGLTFPTVLVAGTANDGSQSITVPNVTAQKARVMVKASGNIFFNVNTQSIAIGYTVTANCATYSNNTVLPVPDGVANNTPGAVVNKTLNVPVAGEISDVNVTVAATHTYTWDMVVVLSHPDGTQAALWNRNCNNPSTGFNILFNDGAPAIVCVPGGSVTGTYSPAAALSQYNGKASNGTWALLAADFWAGDTGSLGNWQLEVCTLSYTLSSEDFGLENFTIYPNPNNGNFNVQFNSVSGNEIKIGVHDMRGRLVFENSYQNTGAINQNVQLNNVQSGIYIVTVQDGEHKEVKKIVIE
ncbi:reprolysin-like metallopeptidase [Flavobacterium sp.]|uniref:zinc-dependent metalloprotease n=1 Tax=Flavobacterium sp. TaxID=239 RepID=UPI0028BF0E30|nr:zinc-dependent metalloprotease family protein [Flavobacterium sp.]